VTGDRLAYTVVEAAKATGFSRDYLHRAIRTDNVDPTAGIHHLPAKRDAKGYRILHGALVAWLEQFPDA
jgi:hypothetical protein